ncbi:MULTISPECIES: carbohydrate kinase family protein [Rhizobium]|uniref:Carbohydrate kinase family protein n=1 Tax=Rhizobium tropici TaxID=398 RepID=A0A329Y4G1_RHITR|nr:MULTISPECIES: carbohydrate kinase family protein [Rhizobium]MBB3285449.1 sugar/nucleoside kinase (ribokinase family) [Rhizobium sp. BK252]MBB3400189.1 sugar/nucleoside kinase (ribokinase family) [Rhizobium sp. BK289]MBB3412768.1 sugar/nucleoside kinase (ribokinase family) [Rhizobium sp. BK284]MBB3480655.1 sugar/nucleoside kinase (ribokinase family) [Rhizobium sp. BK347]RAX38323.1 carbohydrate kinase family protein [Rhizobium tropici]
MRTGEEVQGGEKKDKGGIVCAGNFIVDRVHTLSYWPEQGDLAHILHQDVGVGGGAANVVTDLASLGFPGKLAAAGCIGADIDGEIVKTRLQSAGIDASGLRQLPDHATAHTHVMNVPGQNRTFFYHGGANDAVTDALVSAGVFADAGYRLFYLGYLMLLPGLDTLDADGRSGASRLLEAARNAGLTTCVDFVSSEDPEFAVKVGAALPYCDFLVINEIEAGRATGVTVRDGKGELIEAALLTAGERLLAAGVARGAIIHAPEICFWFAPGHSPIVCRSRPVDPAEIVSTVGAGDAFCAAVLYGLHEDWPVERICAAAHAAAARCLGGATATDGIPDMATLLEDVTAMQHACV